MGKSPPRSDPEDDMEEETDLKKGIDPDLDGESMSDGDHDDMPNLPASAAGDTGLGFNLAALAVPPRMTTRSWPGSLRRPRNLRPM